MKKKKTWNTPKHNPNYYEEKNKAETNDENNKEVDVENNTENTPAKMNRATRRTYSKWLKNVGYGESDIYNLFNMRNNAINAGKNEIFNNGKQYDQTITAGDKVIINIDGIKGHPDFVRLTSDYRDWLEENQGEVFTVEYDKNHRTEPIEKVCLKEDTREIKWLWHVSNLIKIPKQVLDSNKNNL